MEQYYLNEHLILFLNDDKIIKSHHNKCDYIVNYDKPILLNKLMECALLKLYCPEKLFTLPYGDVFTMELKLWFIKPPEMFSSFIKTDFKNIYNFSKIYEYKLTDKKEDSIKQLKEMEIKINIQIKKYYNQRHTYTMDEDPNELQLEFPEIRFYNVDLYFTPLKILDETNKLIFRPAQIIMEKTVIQNKDILVGIGYISLNKALHLHLGIDEEKFPMTELVPEGYHLPPNTVYPDYKQYYRNKEPSELDLKQAKHILLNEQIYLYCDILKESYVNDQKVNILQTFLSEKKVSDNDIRSIEFENLIYIPLRIDEITSISIQLRDMKGALIYYDKGTLNCVIKIRPIEHI